ncbi:unnamed protein product [Chrysoparadoxa australica]
MLQGVAAGAVSLASLAVFASAGGPFLGEPVNGSPLKIPADGGQWKAGYFDEDAFEDEVYKVDGKHKRPGISVNVNDEDAIEFLYNNEWYEYTIDFAEPGDYEVMYELKPGETDEDFSVEAYMTVNQQCNHNMKDKMGWLVVEDHEVSPDIPYLFHAAQTELSIKKEGPQQLRLCFVKACTASLKLIELKRIGESGNYAPRASERDDSGDSAGPRISLPHDRQNPNVVPGIVHAKEFDLPGDGAAYEELSPSMAPKLRAGDDVSGTGTAVSYIQQDEWIRYTIKAEQAGEYEVNYLFGAKMDSNAPVDEFAIYLTKEQVGCDTDAPIAHNFLEFDSDTPATATKFEGGPIELTAGWQTITVCFDSSAANVFFYGMDIEATNLATVNPSADEGAAATPQGGEVADPNGPPPEITTVPGVIFAATSKDKSDGLHAGMALTSLTDDAYATYMIDVIETGDYYVKYLLAGNPAEPEQVGMHFTLHGNACDDDASIMGELSTSVDTNSNSPPEPFQGEMVSLEAGVTTLTVCFLEDSPSIHFYGIDFVLECDEEGGAGDTTSGDAGAGFKTEMLEDVHAFGGMATKLPGFLKANGYDTGPGDEHYKSFDSRVTLETAANIPGREDDDVQGDQKFVGYIEDGEELKYTVYAMEGKQYGVTYSIASYPPSEARPVKADIYLSKGNCDDTDKFAKLELNDLCTGSYEQTAEYGAGNITLEQGKQTLRVCFAAGSYMNFEGITFGEAGSGTNDPGKMCDGGLGQGGSGDQGGFQGGSGHAGTNEGGGGGPGDGTGTDDGSGNSGADGSGTIGTPSGGGGGEVNIPDVPGFTLKWHDEFSGGELDRSTWQPERGGHGWGNNELQCYRDSPENIYIDDDGNLVLRAIKHNQRVNCPNANGGSTGNNQFSSGKVWSHKKMHFGRLEVRMLFTPGQGHWPSAWMMPAGSEGWGGTGEYGGWARSGEIDLIEVLNQMGSTHHSIHFGDRPGGNQMQTCQKFNSPSGYGDGFHTYTLDWLYEESDQKIWLTWYVDGAETCRFSQDSWWTAGPNYVGTGGRPFDQPFYVQLNFAVGGSWPGWPSDQQWGPGQPPQVARVDYVRVWDAPINKIPPSMRGNRKLPESSGDDRSLLKLHPEFLESPDELVQVSLHPEPFNTDIRALRAPFVVPCEIDAEEYDSGLNWRWRERWASSDDSSDDEGRFRIRRNGNKRQRRDAAYYETTPGTMTMDYREDNSGIDINEHPHGSHGPHVIMEKDEWLSFSYSMSSNIKALAVEVIASEAVEQSAESAGEGTFTLLIGSTDCVNLPEEFRLSTVTIQKTAEEYDWHYYGEVLPEDLTYPGFTYITICAHEAVNIDFLEFKDLTDFEEMSLYSEPYWGKFEPQCVGHACAYPEGGPPGEGEDGSGSGSLQGGEDIFPSEGEAGNWLMNKGEDGYGPSRSTGP